MSATVLLGGQVDSIGRGAHDDNLEGSILTKIAQGDLVRVPLSQQAQLSSSGTATASRGGTNANPDNSMYGSTLTVPAGLGNMAVIRHTLYGRVIGVRFQRPSGTTPPFTVKVNGVMYGVRNTRARRNSTAAPLTDNESLFMIADDLLGDGPHTVELSVASDPSVSRSLTVYGWLLEQSKGYAPYPQTGNIPTAPQAVPVLASATTIVSSGVPVRKLLFYNTSGATRTVTVRNGSTNLLRVFTLAAAGTAGTTGQPNPDSYELDFGMPVDVSNLQVGADATGVNLFALGGARVR